MKKRKKQRNREFWETYGEQFARTERHLKAVIAELDRKIAEEKAARVQPDAA